MDLRPKRYLPLFVRYNALYSKYKDRTMVGRRNFIENLMLARLAVDNPALGNGAIIECGTWKGGMSAALIEACGRDRSYVFFDSFEGLPPAGEHDGDRAKAYQADKSSPKYFDNCAATVGEFKATLDRAGKTTTPVDIRQGFFSESFKTFPPPPIAVLRLDADWYDSTMQCLTHFWDSVMPGGLILIDDYYSWDGCSRAVHDFLSSCKSNEHIKQGPLGRVAYISKRT